MEIFCDLIVIFLAILGNEWSGLKEHGNNELQNISLSEEPKVVILRCWRGEIKRWILNTIFRMNTMHSVKIISQNQIREINLMRETDLDTWNYLLHVIRDLNLPQWWIFKVLTRNSKGLTCFPFIFSSRSWD